MKAELRLIVRLFALAVMGAVRVPAADEPSAKAPHPLEGSWRWNFTMPDGTTVRPKLVLAVQDGKVTGTTSFRMDSETPITNAVLKGDEVSFQVIRERDGQQIVTTYSGKWDATSIKGKVESNWAGEKQSYAWDAKRAHFGVEGTWRWTGSFGGRGPGGGGGGRGGGRGRGFQAQVDLEQDGETVTGSMPGFGFGGGPRRIEIKNGVFTNGVVYFEVERNRFGSDEKVISYYEGKQKGDTIKGTIATTNFDGDEVEYEWNAKRAD